MTIKEAFEKLHKAVKKAGLNPFFLINNLKDEFKDIADNVEEGTNVEVEPAQTTGFLVGNIKVNGEDNYLYSIPQPSQPHVYASSEQWVADYWHDGVIERIYEKTIAVSNVNLVQNQMYEVYRDSNIKLFNAYGRLIEDGQIYMIPESGVRIKQSSSVIYLYGTNGTWVNCTGDVIIQYSKIES